MFYDQILERFIFKELFLYLLFYLHLVFNTFPLMGLWLLFYTRIDLCFILLEAENCIHFLSLCKKIIIVEG